MDIRKYTNHSVDEMNKKKRVCVIVPNAFPIKGGFENLVQDLVLALSKKDCDISVVCTELGEVGNGHLKNIKIYPILRNMAEHGKIDFFIGVISFVNLLRTKKFDIIHAHTIWTAGTIGDVGKLLRIPVIMTSHGSDIQKDEEIGYGARLNRIASIIIWFTLKLTDVITVLNKSMIKDAIEAGAHPLKIRVIYNGIDLDKIPSFGGADILQRYEITKDDFIVLYLGRLHPKKCPDDLVKAFPKVVEKVPNARLIFAGKGEEEMKLEGLTSDLNLKDNIIFTGFVSEDEKWDLLNRCDIFALPSVVEGHPITVIEAMACSKPVIATNLGPFPEIIRDGETGLLVPLHSPDELADAIIEFALNEDKRKRMGEMARKDVEERFDINKIADDYLEIYGELISRRVNK